MILFSKMRDVESNKTSGQTKHNSDPSVHEAATCVYDFLRTKARGGVISITTWQQIKNKLKLGKILVFTLRT